MSTSHEEQQTGHHPTFKQYVLVAIILFVITMVEFLLIWDRVGISDDLGASKVPLLVILSAIKFGIVIMFYMHLKFDARLLSGMFLAGWGRVPVSTWKSWAYTGTLWTLCGLSFLRCCTL